MNRECDRTFFGSHAIEGRSRRRIGVLSTILRLIRGCLLLMHHTECVDERSRKTNLWCHGSRNRSSAVTREPSIWVVKHTSVGALLGSGGLRRSIPVKRRPDKSLLVLSWQLHGWSLDLWEMHSCRSRGTHGTKIRWRHKLRLPIRLRRGCKRRSLTSRHRGIVRGPRCLSRRQ